MTKKNILTAETKEKLRIARENRITIESVAANGERSRKTIAGYKAGYTITSAALNWPPNGYNGQVGRIKL